MREEIVEPHVLDAPHSLGEEIVEAIAGVLATQRTRFESWGT